MRVLQPASQRRVGGRAWGLLLMAQPSASSSSSSSSSSYYLAAYAFSGTGIGELRGVRKGDVLVITDRTSDPDWWTGYRTIEGPTVSGYVPSSYLVPLAEAQEQQRRQHQQLQHAGVGDDEDDEELQQSASPVATQRQHHPPSRSASSSAQQQQPRRKCLSPLKALKLEQGLSLVLSQVATDAIDQIDTVLDGLLKEGKDCLIIPLRPPTEQQQHQPQQQQSGNAPPSQKYRAAVEFMRRLNAQGAGESPSSPAPPSATAGPAGARRIPFDLFTRELERFVDEEANRRLHHQQQYGEETAMVTRRGGAALSPAHHHHPNNNNYRRPAPGFPPPHNSSNQHHHHEGLPSPGFRGGALSLSHSKDRSGASSSGYGYSSSPSKRGSGGGVPPPMSISSSIGSSVGSSSSGGGGYKRGRGGGGSKAALSSRRRGSATTTSAAWGGRLQEDPDLQTLVHQYTEELSFIFRMYREKCEMQGPLAPGLGLEAFVKLCVDFGVCSNMITRKRASMIHRQISAPTANTVMSGGQGWLKEADFPWAMVACGIEAYGHVPLMEDYEKAEVFFTHLGLKDPRSLRKWVTHQLSLPRKDGSNTVGSTRLAMK